MKRGSYASRLIADAVSQHTVRPLPRPTMADIDASVYALTFVSAKTGTRTTIHVLALDELHATELADLRIAAMGGTIDDLLLDGTPVARAETGADWRAAVLESETPGEHAHRQHRHDELGDRSTTTRGEAWTGGMARNH